MRISTLIILFFMILGLAVLCALGWWQVNRLYWKEDLIATVNERIKQDPITIPELLEKNIPEENMSYTPVVATGIFDHSKEAYFYATNKSGAAGWNVHTPLIMNDGQTLIVNRGFVPFPMKLPDQRLQGQVSGQQTISGLVRIPLKERPGSSFENAPEKREFYWRSLPQMSAIMRTDNTKEFFPFFVDAYEAEIPGGFPKGGTTIINFRNSHLQYAGTWFGLAATLLIVGGYFLYSRREKGTKV